MKIQFFILKRSMESSDRVQGRVRILIGDATENTFREGEKELK